MKRRRIIVLAFLFNTLLFSCVSKKKYQSLHNDYNELKAKYETLQVVPIEDNQKKVDIQEFLLEHKYIRISIDSFDSDGDMVRKMVTAQLEGMIPKGGALPIVNIEDVTGKEVETISQLIEEEKLPGDTINVANQLRKFSKIDERVIMLDSVTNYAHYALPSINDYRPEFRSELDPNKLKKSNSPLKPIYRISVNGEYEFYDGNPIAGSKSVKKKYKDGYKPVSEVTFFYQAQKNGIIVEGISAKEFLALSREEQKLLLHYAIMMMNKQRKEE